MSNGFNLFLSAFCTFSVVVLAAIACVGSTANYNPINKIFVAQLDLRNIQIPNVFPSSGAPSSSISQLGLPNYFNIGLWSYCSQASNGTVMSCTKPSGIQNFDLRTMLFDNINNNQVAQLVDNLADIILPEDLQNRMAMYNNVVKTTFITILIGICVSFLALIVNLIRWIIHARFVNWIGRFSSFIGFLSLLISGATSLGCYLYVRRLLNQNYGDTGIRLSVGSVFQGIMWGSIFSALLGFILWCSVRSQRSVAYVSRVPMEEKPLIV